MFSKITLFVLVSGLSIIADVFVLLLSVLFFQFLFDVTFSINIISIIQKFKGLFQLPL